MAKNIVRRHYKGEQVVRVDYDDGTSSGRDAPEAPAPTAPEAPTPVVEDRPKTERAGKRPRMSRVSESMRRLERSDDKD